MIFRVIIKVIKGDNAEDVRSDENDTDVEQAEHKHEKGELRDVKTLSRENIDALSVKKENEVTGKEVKIEGTKEVIEVQSGSRRE